MKTLGLSDILEETDPDAPISGIKVIVNDRPGPDARAAAVCTFFQDNRNEMMRIANKIRKLMGGGTPQEVQRAMRAYDMMDTNRLVRQFESAMIIEDNPQPGPTTTTLRFLEKEVSAQRPHVQVEEFPKMDILDHDCGVGEKARIIFPDDNVDSVDPGIHPRTQDEIKIKTRRVKGRVDVNKTPSRAHYDVLFKFNAVSSCKASGDVDYTISPDGKHWSEMGWAQAYSQSSGLVYYRSNALVKGRHYRDEFVNPANHLVSGGHSIYAKLNKLPRITSNFAMMGPEPLGGWKPGKIHSVGPANYGDCPQYVTEKHNGIRRLFYFHDGTFESAICGGTYYGPKIMVIAAEQQMSGGMPFLFVDVISINSIPASHFHTNDRRQLLESLNSSLGIDNPTLVAVDTSMEGLIFHTQGPRGSSQQYIKWEYTFDLDKKNYLEIFGRQPLTPRGRPIFRAEEIHEFDVLGRRIKSRPDKQRSDTKIIYEERLHDLPFQYSQLLNAVSGARKDYSGCGTIVKVNSVINAHMGGTMSVVHAANRVFSIIRRHSPILAQHLYHNIVSAEAIYGGQRALDYVASLEGELEPLTEEEPDDVIPPDVPTRREHETLLYINTNYTQRNSDGTLTILNNCKAHYNPKPIFLTHPDLRVTRDDRDQICSVRPQVIPPGGWGTLTECAEMVPFGDKRHPCSHLPITVNKQELTSERDINVFICTAIDKVQACHILMSAVGTQVVDCLSMESSEGMDYPTYMMEYTGTTSKLSDDRHSDFYFVPRGAHTHVSYELEISAKANEWSLPTADNDIIMVSSVRARSDQAEPADIIRRITKDPDGTRNTQVRRNNPLHPYFVCPFDFLDTTWATVAQCVAYRRALGETRFDDLPIILSGRRLTARPSEWWDKRGKEVTIETYRESLRQNPSLARMVTGTDGRVQCLGPDKELCLGDNNRGNNIAGTVLSALREQLM